MTRNLKALGLALAAVFAMSALVASAAQAMNGEEFFHTDLPGNPNNSAHSAILTGESNEPTLSIPGAAPLVCAHGVYQGTQEAETHENEGGEKTLTTKSVTVHPTYTGPCTFGSASVEVFTNECHYELSATTPASTSAEALNNVAPVKVICPENQFIEIKETSFGVVIKIGSQSPGGGAHYTSLNPGSTNEKDVLVHANVTGISGTCAPSFFCGLVGIPSSFSNAEYKDTVTTKAYEDEKETATGIYEEDAQLGAWQGPTS